MAKELGFKMSGPALERFERLMEKLGLSEGEEMEGLKISLQVCDYLVDQHLAGTIFLCKKVGETEPKEHKFFTQDEPNNPKVVPIDFLKEDI